MERLGPLFYSPPADLTTEHMSTFDFDEFASQIQGEAPLVWNIADKMVYSSKQRARNAHKNPKMVILSIISQAQYTRSHRRGKITKLWSVFLRSCGLSARAFDALHELGTVMSHKWAANAYGALSHHAMERARKAVQIFPWVITHDNVNIPMRVFSQRLHNQSHFISGCAATLWTLPSTAALSPDINRNYQKYTIQSRKTRFSLEDLLDGNPAIHDRLKNRYIHHILQILLDSPEFRDYKHAASNVLKPPPPVCKLPCGPDHVVGQYVLHTANQEEASYEGTDKVIIGIFRQLGLYGEDERIKTALERFIVWIGDQLTVERLRGLHRYRYEDMNSYDRMDYMLPMFGWFHLIMAFAHSLHRQYLGNSAVMGSLQQAFDLLKRKGLQKTETKGPFWHHLNEALHHVSEAHLKALWLTVARVASLTELQSKYPDELLTLAATLYNGHASRLALTKMKGRPLTEQDKVQMQWTMWNIDILPYVELLSAIKNGDVGRMEDLLPTLLFRFIGGGNPKYSIEILELLQGLRQEWPEEIRDYVRRQCWLMNRSGKPGAWTPFDQGQEQNIADIKAS
ncbi:hypothetical protein PAXINDRAFT_12088 [Paxillus involutus ATCC 200175]|uniref:DUF6589 domain-containing protein n=1 Tax=Paxillus involutus ATCC 200175 TaxID=664439 RepID=A0A0C9SYR7_PAXIN|nr:hypothetical protein PAXINDRAFT_12088 [Paxillus involutus ATCC 200175]